MKPYNPDACCGADCAYHGTNNEPCWGDVEVVDEVQYGDGDYGWVHECEGHRGVYEGEKYKPQS